MKYVYSSIFQREFDDYITMRKAANMKIKDDAYTLASLDSFLVQQGAITKELTEQILLNWLQSMNVKPITKKRKLFCIRGLAKYLRSLGYDIFTPELPKAVSSYVPYIFSEPELRDIINASDNLAAKFSGMQAPVLMPLLIRMLYGCGLRLGEAMALRWHDVNLVDGIIKIRYAKNEKQRIVPMHETLTKLCQIYFESYSSVDVQNDYIFKNCKGTPYCQTWIRQLFSQILKSAGIEYMRSEKQERGPCLHCFRHLFVFHSLTNSASNGRCFEDSVPFLSTYLGHNSIMETDKYLRFSYELNHDAHRIVSAYTGNVFPTVEDL